MSNGKVFERLWKLQATVNKLVLDGNRDPERLCELLQRFIETNRTVFTVTGLGLRANEWMARFESNGNKLSEFACNILSMPEYDLKHRLEAGRQYKVVLVRGTEIRNEDDRTSTNFKALASREFGPQSVSSLKGEFALLIREKFRDDELQELGLQCIAVLHEPIVGSNGRPGILDSRRWGGSYVRASQDDPSRKWNRDEAFAFLVH